MVTKRGNVNASVCLTVHMLPLFSSVRAWAVSHLQLTCSRPSRDPNAPSADHSRSGTRYHGTLEPDTVGAV
jgi:hypothetical protein